MYILLCLTILLKCDCLTIKLMFRIVHFQMSMQKNIFPISTQLLKTLSLSSLEYLTIGNLIQSCIIYQHQDNAILLLLYQLVVFAILMSHPKGRFLGRRLCVLSLTKLTQSRKSLCF